MNSARLPLRHDLRLAYAGSLLVAIVMTIVAVAGILYRDAIYATTQISSSVGSDAFNLVFILPILLISMWLASRGRLIGMLLWPGALFYVLYIYAFYVISVPFGVLFLPFILLAVLSAYTMIAIIASIDGEALRQRLIPVTRGGQPAASSSPWRSYSS